MYIIDIKSFEVYKNVIVLLKFFFIYNLRIISNQFCISVAVQILFEQ